jgi:hypothetical protein
MDRLFMLFAFISNIKSTSASIRVSRKLGNNFDESLISQKSIDTLFIIFTVRPLNVSDNREGSIPTTFPACDSMVSDSIGAT